jgi:hypothetical protein
MGAVGVTEALGALSHELDDAAQHITEREAYDFATRIRVLIGIDGDEAARDAIAASAAPVSPEPADMGFPISESPASQPAEAVSREKLIDLIAEHLSGTYHCMRVWSAWGVGTMSQDDFEDVGESDTPTELADAILALAGTQAAAEPAVGRVEIKGGKVSFFAFEQTDIADGEYRLFTVPGRAAAVEPAAQSEGITKAERNHVVGFLRRNHDAAFVERIAAALAAQPPAPQAEPSGDSMFGTEAALATMAAEPVEPAKVETEDEINLRAWARGYAQERGAKQFMSAGKTYNTATGLLVATMAAEPVAPAKMDGCCPHDIHYDNACGACVPPRGTK